MKLSKKFFPSYAEIPNNKNIIIEHVLIYGDVDDIYELLDEYGVETCKEVWLNAIVPDDRYRKLNFFLAKFFFNISRDDKEIDEFIRFHKEKNARINKILNRQNSTDI